MCSERKQIVAESTLPGVIACSVASITVTYNGAEILSRHIDALLRQRQPLREVIVVDNASTDGTDSMLAARYPQVTVLRMPGNLGTGGALAAGLSYAALKKKYDWIWMFDQDSVPAPDALEIMLQELDRLEGDIRKIGILATLPVTQKMGISSTPWLWRDRFVKPPVEVLGNPVLFVDMVITSGSMVTQETVETIGLPRSDFFIDFVDYEYCLRARSRGYKIVVVTRAKLFHEVGKARTLHLLRRHLWAEHPPFREYYYSRNFAYSVWWLLPSLPAKVFLILHLARRAVGVLIFGPKRLAALKRMLQGIRDGYRASLGIRFQPD